ncbi:MAG: Rossman fold protein, TIGR00730 family [Chloroflexi bacterium RBG_16_58_8]|nr:MAG: Rossman fold protein, TIGR00730 family [Chloroflexi bacterium RBG_16_58_8]
MPIDYEINQMAKEESWRMFRIIGELVEGFDSLADIVPAVTIYGSARLPPEDPLYRQVEEIAYHLGKVGFSIMTGGGPGCMEAANKGAKRAGVKSIGLNISLPEEQVPNPYADRSITFHHFFVRKVMLVKYATAFIITPGGLGTLDELTEVLTLMQTQKIKPFPVILFKSDYWRGFLEWLKGTVLACGAISEEDFELLRVFDNPADVVNAVVTWDTRQEVTGIKALHVG